MQFKSSSGFKKSTVVGSRWFSQTHLLSFITWRCFLFVVVSGVIQRTAVLLFCKQCVCFCGGCCVVSV